MAAPSPDDPNALGSDGLPKFAHTTSQTFGGKKSTVAQVYNQLKGCTVRANYVVRISLIKKLVVIACLLCNKELGIINPTASKLYPPYQLYPPQANSILRTSRTVTEPGQPTVTYIADLDSRRAFWSVTAAKQFPILAKAAVRLLSVHVSTAAAERNWSVWTSIYRNGLRSKLSVEQAEKLVYLKANSRDETDTLTLPKDVRINIFA
ncbi:hypothetical protein QJQ45_004859 [Haematococcus lacustris]|nr:hypothetical protein QJQ45_004859 [Haematococcus lacustris]